MIRHLILQIVILSLSLPALCSCREDDGPDGPGTPLETPADTTAGDFHIIYRSSNSADVKPVNSIRMHMLRDGIQDYEKARIIGHQKLRTVMRDFTDSTGDDASAVVKRAQSEIKKLSSR